MNSVSLNSRPFEQTLDRFAAADQRFSFEQPGESSTLPNWVPVGSDTWLFGGPLSAKHLADIVIDALTGEVSQS